jgi:putative transcriptional regulator
LDELRRLRKMKGLSQVELAERSGVSAYTITETETGQREPHGRTLRKLAAALGVEVADLFPKGRTPLPEPDDGQRRGAHPGTFDAEGLGRALAAQWWAALDDAEATKARPDIYGAQLFRLSIDASKARASFEAAAQGGYASRPEFREVLKLMDKAHSAITAQTKKALGGITAEMAEGFVRDFEEVSFDPFDPREGVGFDAP